jgi:hypothetical protein
MKLSIKVMLIAWCLIIDVAVTLPISKYCSSTIVNKIHVYCV